jgi:LacI family transcriptional regulator
MKFWQPSGRCFIAPIFKEESLKFTNELKANHIPFSFIDSMIEEADFVTYYGQNSVQSGYIAAKFVLNSLPEFSKVLVIRTQRKGAVSNQTLNRYNGFMQYMADNQLKDKIELINLELKDDDENTNFELLSNVFSVHANIKASITFNSKVFRLAKHLQTLNHSSKTIATTY